MQSEQVKGRFGRCPYCRATIYQDPKAVIYYCSKCRTPIRGKNPEPANEDEYTLAQLEILSFDTMSVFSDELEQSDAANLDTGRRDREAVAVSSASLSSSPYRGFNSVRTGRRSGDLDRYEEIEDGRSGSPVHDRVSELRPASRRTRRPMSADLDAPREDGPRGGSGLDVPRTRSASCYQRRASPLSSQELERSMNLSGGHEPAPSGLARSPLTDPTFQQNLLHALENLRKLIVAVEEPHRQAIVAPASAPSDDRGARAVTRRDSRLLRRLESQLTQALPANDSRQIATTTTTSSSSSSSSASSSRRGGESLRSRASRQLCRPILGGMPFVACDKCSELLQLPAAVSAHKVSRLQCGECDEVLEVTLPASTVGSAARPRKIFSAPQAAAVSGSYNADEYARARRHLSGEQLRQGPDEGPLHRVLGYSSVSSVLRSRRYEEYS